MTDIRYGIGSLEEEIRILRDHALSGKSFTPVELTEEELAEGANIVRLKRDRTSVIGHKAELSMKVVNGKPVFTLKHTGVGSSAKVEKNITAKQLAGKLE